MRMHGSITPKMILPLLLVAAESTVITTIYMLVYDSEWYWNAKQLLVTD